ncbi:SprT-like domain-containing protein [Cochleicola gelatinilyticus]|uniref:Metallopeptidase n=1 Tax=Cochleicola gelatinilyticus TaxID=1763537 RepID=A0A167IH75_9FLAO|nr:SprT-like domain-containing protein [Cochleicola gelatinilyticus]OAB79648.1 metallopeptidase [Cochleicola gelatinilyticus]
MTETLEKYIPKAAVAPVFELIRIHHVHLKIVNERVSRHGDYRKLPDGAHQITVNANLNQYRFLMTLVHEIAHLVAFQKYGRAIKPHGLEWKRTFQVLMLPLIRPEIFPNKILPLLAIHFKNPKATSDTDARLSLALKQFDPPNDKNYIFEIPMGGTFRLPNGRMFKRGNKRVKRYECLEIASGRIYLFNPNAEVEFIK